MEFDIQPEDLRITVDPIYRPVLYKFVLDAERSFWSALEIDYSSGYSDYCKLTAGKQRLTKYMLVFFASGDQIVGSNAGSRLCEEVPFPESKLFYTYQAMIESTHARVYSSLLVSIIPDEVERKSLIDAVSNWASVSALIDYIKVTANMEERLSLRLFRMICVEGVMFQAPFLWIYWMQSLGELKSLTQANGLIAPDEWQHVCHGIEVYKLIRDNRKLTISEVKYECEYVVNLCEKYVADALPANLPGMNADDTMIHIKSVLDSILELMGYDKIYGVVTPYDFMLQLGLIKRADFFEVKPTTYSQQMPLSGEIDTEKNKHLTFISDW